MKTRNENYWDKAEKHLKVANFYHGLLKIGRFLESDLIMDFASRKWKEHMFASLANTSEGFVSINEDLTKIMEKKS